MTFKPLSDDEDEATTIPEYPTTPGKGDAQFDDDADIEDPGADPGKKGEDEDALGDLGEETELDDDTAGFGSDEDEVG